jgi:hypothetical protein
MDFFAGGYVAMGIKELGLPPEKVNTIADFEVKRFGVQSNGGADAAMATALAELADLVARSELEVPISGVFALDDVRDAFREACVAPHTQQACTPPVSVGRIYQAGGRPRS